MSQKLRITLGAVLASFALCAGDCLAAHQIPPRLHNADSAEQAMFIHQEGQRSLNEKLQAGQERLALRQEFRAALVQGIRANAMSRKEYKTTDTYPALARLRARSETVWLPWALLALMATMWFAVQWCRTGKVRLLPPRA